MINVRHLCGIGAQNDDRAFAHDGFCSAAQ